MNEQELIEKLRTLLRKANKPLFMVDDDPDGLCAYILLKRYTKKGNLIILRSSPELGTNFIEHVERFSPDLIIILDKAKVSEDFLDAMHAPVIWIDHHEPQKTNVHYYNPRNYDDSVYVPTSECAWRITQQDEWIAGVGIIDDWKIPPFMDDLLKKYPDLLKKTDNPGELRFDTLYGKVCLMFNAVFKGDLKDAQKAIRLLEELQSPYELLEGKEKYQMIIDKYEDVQKSYNEHRDKAFEKAEETKDIIVYLYASGKHSVTSLLSEELSYRNPDKAIIVGREKEGFYRMSIRSQQYPVHEALARALEGTTGYGGGHPHSCGASVPVQEFEEFLEKFREEWRTDKEEIDLEKH